MMLNKFNRYVIHQNKNKNPKLAIGQLYKLRHIICYNLFDRLS